MRVRSMLAPYRLAQEPGSRECFANTVVGLVIALGYGLI